MTEYILAGPRRWVWAGMLLLLLSWGGGALGADLYTKDGKPFCDAYDCARLLPDIENFRRSDATSLPVLEAMRGEEVVAYLFLSTDLVNIPAYSGKPLVTLIAIDTKGIILNATVLHHAEPILLVGIPESVLDEYLKGYVGHHIGEHLEGGKRTNPETGKEEVDVITGATVTALVLEETLLTSAREVGRSLGLLPEEERVEITWKADYTPMTWAQLLQEGSIGHLRVEAREMGLKPENGEPWIDLYFGDLSTPVTGINLLGESTYNWAMARLEPGQRLFFIVSNGINSFKGSGFVRGGIYDRFHFVQGLNRFSFRDLDYENLYGLKAEGAPRFKESGLFFLRDKRLDPTSPWDFIHLASRLTGETAHSKTFQTFSTEYHLPEKYYSVVRTRSVKRASLTQRIWQDQWLEALVLGLFLLGVMVVFWFRDKILVSHKRLEATHVTVLVLSVMILGVWMKTPPSVTQIFPLLQVFDENFNPGLFLADPLLFVFWIVITISLLVWGRGWFCGWICPYGAMLELWHKITRHLLPKSWQLELPDAAHNIMRRLRYVILGVLVVLALFSVEWAERLAEVEPFKTTWLVGIFNREPLYTVWWWALLLIAAVNFRSFCRYLCPLGAALSIGSLFQWKRIRRREYCQVCKICAKGCEPRAIDALGRVNRYECLNCFECEQKYFDDTKCPPLIFERKGQPAPDLRRLLAKAGGADQPKASD